MDPLARKRLEERIVEEVHIMLTEGDYTYLRGLPRAALLEAVETELRFLGFYSHNDQETPAVIRLFLEKHLDQWAEDYLRQHILNEWQPSCEIKLQTEVAPWMQEISSEGIGKSSTKTTHYIGFSPPLKQQRIDISSMSEQDTVA